VGACISLLIVMPIVGNADNADEWVSGGVSMTPQIPNIRKCADQPGVRFGRKWNWHYPRETPKIRNGAKALKCANGKKGLLYTRDNIKGKYFVTNAKYLKVTPILDNACAAVKRYCNPAVTEQLPIKATDYKGSVSYLFPPGVFKRADIQQLATGQVQNKALRAVFERSGWVKGGAIISMNELPSKNSKVDALAGLLNNDREVMSIMNIDHGGSSQAVLATWDLATEQLVRMVTLPSQVHATKAVTPDLKTIFGHDFRVKGKRTFAMFDTRSGKHIRVIYKKPASDPVVSPNGKYVAALTSDKPPSGQLSNQYWRVWRVSDSQEMAKFSSMEACFGHRNLSGSFVFSPDSSKFYIGWKCGKSTTDDDNYSSGKRYGWLGDTKTWQAARVEKLDDAIGDGEFSADGKLLVTYSNDYDLSTKKRKKFSHCEGTHTRLGKPIPGTPLHLYLTDSRYEFRTALNSKCHIVIKHIHCLFNKACFI